MTKLIRFCPVCKGVIERNGKTDANYKRNKTCGWVCAATMREAAKAAKRNNSVTYEYKAIDYFTLGQVHMMGNNNE